MLPAPKIEQNPLNVERIATGKRRADVVIDDILRPDGIQHLTRARQPLVGVDADKAAIKAVAQANCANLADGKRGCMSGSLGSGAEQECTVSHRGLAKKH